MEKFGLLFKNKYFSLAILKGKGISSNFSLHNECVSTNLFIGEYVFLSMKMLIVWFSLSAFIVLISLLENIDRMFSLGYYLASEGHFLKIFQFH